MQHPDQSSLALPLQRILPPSRIRASLSDRLSFASDAGFYLLIPQAVVQVKDELETVALFRFSQENRVPLVFRAGGTSLSGQSITDGILVDLSQFWDGIKVEDSGNLVRVQPGITGAMVNAHLKKYRRKIGPDPSSISAAMMGGILSNNASGMCCGVALNSYHTTRYIRFILPDGKSFSTEEKKDYPRFEQECPDLCQCLRDIRRQIAQNPDLHAKIRQKYQSKNTVGYSLNAFVDYEHPLDVLAHLLIGGEGTLAFISEAVLNTVPDYPCKSTGLLYFPDIFTACQAIVPLSTAGALMVELMDRASLRSVEDLAGMPPVVKTLPDQAAALLVEFQADSPEELGAQVQRFLDHSAELSLYKMPEFSSDPADQDFFWKVRKGLFPAVGAVRASGETVILEDLAFPVEKLGEAILDLQALFQKHGYSKGIIFGHAKDGNIHFVITQSLNEQQEVQRYDHFLQEVVELVVKKYDGALKAEHGTGRNMAPFVETEWGEEAYAIMARLKAAVDPHGLLNPGVIINADPQAHLKDLKELHSVESEVDKCIECGFCEHKCPSRDLSASPRRRIVLRRALKRLQEKGGKDEYERLLKEYQYEGLDTCAVDGLCATACPVDINTGDLVKRLRRENHSESANKRALWAARNFGLLEKTARLALKSGDILNKVFGKNAMSKITGGLRKIIPAMPRWTAQLSALPSLTTLKNRQTSPHSEQPGIVYFPACISRLLGGNGSKKNLMEVFLSVCQKSGHHVVVPDNISGTCCSQIFSSKGHLNAQAFMANQALDMLWTASQQGLFPIVIDVSSCAHTLQQLRPVLNAENQKRFDRLRILDSVDFLHDFVLPRVKPRSKKSMVVLHPVCALHKMKTATKFSRIAEHFAAEVIVPLHSGCCGMAGDRGFLFPELTAAATLPVAKELEGQHFEGHYSSTKTCEMALSEATQRHYESILYLVDEGLDNFI